MRLMPHPRSLFCWAVKHRNKDEGKIWEEWLGFGGLAVQMTEGLTGEESGQDVVGLARQMTEGLLGRMWWACWASPLEVSSCLLTK